MAGPGEARRCGVSNAEVRFMNVEYDVPWKRAVKLFEQADFEIGDIITNAWLENAFNLPDITKETIEEYYSAKINNTQTFIDQLLVQKKIYLANVKGKGYKIIHPKKQTGMVLRSFANSLKTRTTKAMDQLEHIDKRRLNHNQKKENSDAKAALSMIDGYSRKRLTGPPKK